METRTSDAGTKPIIKTCACGRAYTREQWEALPLVGRQDGAGESYDLRNCAACASTLNLRAEEDARTERPSWRSFRLMMVRIAREVGLPERVAVYAEDLDYEGDVVVPALYSVWANVEAELKDGDAWEDLAYAYVHDLVLDLGGTVEQARAAGELAETTDAQTVAVRAERRS